MFKFTDTKALSDAGAWIHLKDNGVPAYLDAEKKLPIRVKVLGPDSPILQEKIRKRSAKKLKEKAGAPGIKKMSIPEIEAFLAETMEQPAQDWADATIDWENMPQLDGQPVSFSPEAAVEIYTRYPAITRQLTEDAGSISDFLEIAEKA